MRLIDLLGRATLRLPRAVRINEDSDLWLRQRTKLDILESRGLALHQVGSFKALAAAHKARESGDQVVVELRPRSRP